MALAEQNPNDQPTRKVLSEIERRFDEFSSAVCQRLDDLEERLPPIPAKAIAFGRAGADRIGATTGGIARDISRQVTRVNTVAGNAVRTSVGQTRSAVDRTVTVARHNTKEAVGQARAQTKRSGRAAEQAAVALIDDATRAVERGDATPAALDEWTRAELYERAQELDIPGRSTMDKRELIDAIHAA
jgi:hypothetical protein